MKSCLLSWLEAAFLAVSSLPDLVQDYLTAPMPYLIGIPAPQLLQGLEHMGLEEVVFVDLDAGTCKLGSQDGPDMDHALLPWAHHLRAAFQVS